MLERLQNLIMDDIDVDELFYGLRDEDEITWEDSMNLGIEKSATCK